MAARKVAPYLPFPAIHGCGKADYLTTVHAPVERVRESHHATAVGAPNWLSTVGSPPSTVAASQSTPSAAPCERRLMRAPIKLHTSPSPGRTGGCHHDNLRPSLSPQQNRRHRLR